MTAHDMRVLIHAYLEKIGYNKDSYTVKYYRNADNQRIKEAYDVLITNDSSNESFQKFVQEN